MTYDFIVIDNKREIGPKKITNAKQLYEQMKAVQFNPNFQRSWKLKLFYQGITDDKESVDNKYGGWFNIVSKKPYSALRCFSYLSFLWVENKLWAEISSKINGFSFHIEQNTCSCKIFVNDGFISENLQARYEYLSMLIYKSMNSDPNDISLDFKVNQTYWRIENPQETRKTAFRIMPFASHIIKMDPKILNIPEEKTFALSTVSIHKMKRSEKREREKEQST